jgi:toxin ParE1/3/4
MPWSRLTRTSVTIRPTDRQSHAHEPNLPGLRFWPLTCDPYLIFYIERPQHIDVWRVLHGQRDIPAWMQEPDTFESRTASARIANDDC